MIIKIRIDKDEREVLEEVLKTLFPYVSQASSKELVVKEAPEQAETVKSL